jgi:hypothetical protein
MSSTSWQQITINLTTEGASKFILDSWYTGNSVLDLNKIKSYQILTSGGNPKSYAIDFIFATAESGGVVSTIYITREGDASGSNVRVTWEATSNVDIWTKTGTFDTTPASWTKEFANVSGTSQVDSSVAGKVGSGTNKWYKVMPAGATLATGDLTQEVLGKFDLVLTEGFNFISLPLVTSTNSIASVIGTQMTGGFIPPLADKVYKFKADKSGFEQAWLNSSDNTWYDIDTGLASTMTITSDTGYWFELANGHVSSNVSIVGRISNVSRGPTSISSGFNLIGSTYPVSVTIQSSGIRNSGATAGMIPPLACKIYSFKNDKSGFEQAWLNGADNKWYDIDTGLESTMTLTAGKACWIEEPNSFNWNYPKPY